MHAHRLLTAFAATLVLAAPAAAQRRVPPAPAPLGTIQDEIFRQQELNAEATKYVVHMHEFELNPTEEGATGGWRLNDCGEDHLKQIAVNAKRGDAFPIVVERSRTSVKEGTDYRYPVHLNDRLDEQRRQVVVAALERMGLDDAEQRVVVAPAFAEGLPAMQAAGAYNRSGQAFGGFGFGGNSGFGGFTFGGLFGR